MRGKADEYPHKCIDLDLDLGWMHGRSPGRAALAALLCLTIRVNNHDFDMQSLEGVTLPRTVAVRRPQ